jgi:hypothetical protein
MDSLAPVIHNPKPIEKPPAVDTSPMAKKISVYSLGKISP